VSEASFESLECTKRKGVFMRRRAAPRATNIWLWRVYILSPQPPPRRAQSLDIYGPSGQYFKYKQGDIPFYLTPKEFQRPTVVNEKSGGIRPLLYQM
jgi:hypothetical protein